MPSRMKWLYFLCLLVVAAMTLSGCVLRTQPSLTVDPLPSVAATPSAVKEPLRVLVLCLDTPPWFSSALFHKAANAVSDKIDRLVNPGFGGMYVYVIRISSSSYGDDALHVRIPAVAPEAAPPQQPQKTDDPYGYTEALRNYHAQLAQWRANVDDPYQRALAQLQRWVKSQTDQLRTLADPFDGKGSDIYGCLDKASNDFQQTPGPATTIMVLVSTMINNTAVGEGARVNLSGVKVEVMWQPCQSAAFCQTLNDGWRKVFRQFGTEDVSFKNPAVSDEVGPQF